MNMSFTYASESDNKLPFLDIVITRENTFTTNIYRKPFSGLYTNFHSFLPENYKTGLVHTIVFRIDLFSHFWSEFIRCVLIGQIVSNYFLIDYFWPKQ